MKKLLAIATLVIAAQAAYANAGVIEPGTPKEMRVKLLTADSKPRLRVAKKLRVVTSCNQACQAQISMKLITPIKTLEISGGRPLPEGAIWSVSMILNQTALNYLRDTYRQSKMRVRFTAVSSETGERDTKIRIFRFYR